MEESGVDGNEPGCSGWRGGAVQRPELEAEAGGEKLRSSPDSNREGQETEGDEPLEQVADGVDL
jgi:hypothetical protein